MIDYTLSVSKLIAVLQRLQPTDRVTVNTVGNLSVLRAEGEERIGYIQIRNHLPDDELLELYEPERKGPPDGDQEQP